MATTKATKEPEVARDAIEGTWRGVTVWQCPFCERNRDDRAAIEEHIARDHPVYVPHPLAAVAPQENAHGTAATDEIELQRGVSDGGGDADGNG
jgi:hypothetical protein